MDRFYHTLWVFPWFLECGVKSMSNYSSMCTSNNATASFKKTSLILALCACKLEKRSVTLGYHQW